MKVIYTNTILSVQLVAGVANAQYPVGFVLNEYPRKPFKATGNSATIRVAEAGGSDAIALFATNADEITITAAIGVSVLMGSDETGQEIELGTDEAGEAITLSDRGDQPVEVLYEYTKQNENNGVIWMELPRSGFQRTLDFACRTNDDILQVGILVAGEVLHVREMERRAYRENAVDFSFSQELQSGNRFYNDLGRARMIPLSVFLWGGDGDEPAGFTTYRDFYYKYVYPFGAKPKAWLLSESFDVSHYAVWAQVEVMPGGEMHGEHMLISMVLREVN